MNSSSSVNSRIPLPTSSRSGISLLEVMISIGVIALGIFGVASLIPVAQFKVAEGTSIDRIASLGPSAAARFRIEGMNDPSNWYYANKANVHTQAPSAALIENQGYLSRRAYCIDPLWIAEGGYNPQGGSLLNLFPISAANLPKDTQLAYGMQRLGLKRLKTAGNNRTVEAALARKVFLLSDELVFDRPSNQGLPPNRQFFYSSPKGVNQATANVTNATMSWFATLCPYGYNSEDYILSVVIVKNRFPLMNLDANGVVAIAMGEEKITQAFCPYSGEIHLQNVAVNNDQELKVSDLAVGDWILLSKPAEAHKMVPNGPKSELFKRTFRWTQIIGASDDQSSVAEGFRSFTISNDDFLRPVQPGEDLLDQDYSAILVRGVESVYERTIRLEKKKTTSL